jgi:hypothetical protein
MFLCFNTLSYSPKVPAIRGDDCMSTPSTNLLRKLGSDRIIDKSSGLKNTVVVHDAASAKDAGESFTRALFVPTEFIVIITSTDRPAA